MGPRERIFSGTPWVERPGEVGTHRLSVISCATYMTEAQPVDAPFRISTAPSESEFLAKYFRVLADRGRLQILEVLIAEGEVSVGELTRSVGLSQPNVSNHLACLRWCGFVETRREHRTAYNRIADPRVVELIALARELLEANEDHIASCRRA
jgi:ArsR family transcriptional regulator, cadmium/lead-responsive transcriptional repressor